MRIEEDALNHWIDNFYGYGSWQAPFWFVSYEEGGGELPDEVADRIDYFRRTHAQPKGELCNIRDLYKNVHFKLDGPKADLFNNLYEHRFDLHATQHGIWKNLILFVHGYQGLKLPDLLSYQQNHFLSPSTNNEALIPFYPLPSPHNHAWYYSWLEFEKFGFIKSRESYEKSVYQRRMDTILLNIRRYKPKVILMYGMNNINILKKSVQAVFEGVNFKMIQATKLQIPQHHRADFNGTTLLITTQIPALRHNRVETGFDWEAFGKKVKTEKS